MAENNISQEMEGQARRAAAGAAFKTVATNPWAVGIIGGVTILTGAGLALWLWLRGRGAEPVIYAQVGSTMSFTLTPLESAVVWAQVGNSMTFTLTPQAAAVVWAQVGDTLNLSLTPQIVVIWAQVGSTLSFILSPEILSVLWAQVNGTMNFTLTPSIGGYVLETAVVPNVAQAVINRNPDKPSYEWGELVTLSTVSGGYWVFSHWEVDGVYNSSPPSALQLEMYSDRLVQAFYNYEPPQQQYALTISIDIGGTGYFHCIPSPGSHIYDQGTEVTLYGWTDLPPTEYICYWEIDGVPVYNSNIKIIMNHNTIAVLKWYYVEPV